MLTCHYEQSEESQSPEGLDILRSSQDEKNVLLLEVLINFFAMDMQGNSLYNEFYRGLATEVEV